jgi:hypothetical protein
LAVDGKATRKNISIGFNDLIRAVVDELKKSDAVIAGNKGTLREGTGVTRPTLSDQWRLQG